MTPKPLTAVRNLGRRVTRGPDWTRRLGSAAPDEADTTSWETPSPPDSNGSASAATTVDLQRREQELAARVAELQWDLGGLVYEMAIRDNMRLDVLVRRAAVLQDADAQLGEVERILRLDATRTAGSCGSCGALHSRGAVFCWQCGQPLLQHVSSETIARS